MGVGTVRLILERSRCCWMDGCWNSSFDIGTLSLLLDGRYGSVCAHTHSERSTRAELDCCARICGDVKLIGGLYACTYDVYR